MAIHEASKQDVTSAMKKITKPYSFEHAQRILDELAQVGRDEQETLSCCHYHLGLLDLKQGRLRSARQQLEASIQIDQTIGDVSGAALGRQALAPLHAERQRT